MRKVHGLAAAAFLIIGVAGAASPALAQADAPGLAIGMTLTRADYDGGNFRQGAGTAWTEYQGERVMYHFREIGRTADAVTLLDSSRDTRIELNMVRRMIRVSWNHNLPFEDLYLITSELHRAGGGGARPAAVALPVTASDDSSAQENFKIEAGAIASEREANARCPGLAYRVHGSWTGGWERRDGIASVCIIRFAR